MSLVTFKISDHRNFITAAQADAIKDYAINDVRIEPIEPLTFKEDGTPNGWDHSYRKEALEKGKTHRLHDGSVIAHIDLITHFHGVNITVERAIANKSTAAMAENRGPIRQGEAPAFNDRCHVAIPMANAGLMAIDEVEVQYDYCTERLQGRINDGWRILAICVQPDQRRPDYVLGRIDRSRA